MKKKILTGSIISIFLIIIGIILYFFVIKKDKIEFKLYGLKELQLNYLDKYKEMGAKLFINKKEQKIVIKGKVNTKKLGVYELKYMYNDKLLAKRKIKVLDKEKPKMKLIGDEKIEIIESQDFNDPGCEVTDNFTKKLKIITEGNVDNTKVGEYTITYKTEDSSKNKSSLKRTVIVNEKPKEIIKELPQQEYDVAPVVNNVGVENRLTNMTFTSNGIYVTGCAPSNVIASYLNLGEYKFNTSGNCYSANIDLSNISNGTYTLKINNEYNVYDFLDYAAQIKRGRVGNKLATFDYTGNTINITIKDFYYDYDVIIDVGHGGYDTGAVNSYKYEKDMNLEVSLYEKSLYEQAGYKVLLTRDGDYYPAGMGPDCWPALRRLAYRFGYYSVTSKVAYSNHHNAVGASYVSGFQMYVSTKMQNMNTELSIFNQVSNIYQGTNNGVFTREYYNGGIVSKRNGEYYDWTNYYAVLRLPADLFNNNHVTIYEGSFMSNIDDYIRYWQNGLWKEVSKIKVNNYIAKMQTM